jgi:hypothetical protein
MNNFRIGEVIQHESNETTTTSRHDRAAAESRGAEAPTDVIRAIQHPATLDGERDHFLSLIIPRVRPPTTRQMATLQSRPVDGSGTALADALPAP